MGKIFSLGMVGGGPGSLIGPVHRMAAELDGRFRLVAGSFSSHPDRSRQGAQQFGIAPERAYSDYRAMFAAEAGQLDAIAVVTPNDLHWPVARAALEAGFHVISDKPATAKLSEALSLRRAISASGRLYALTFTYTGYEMVREARAMIKRGDLGAIRKVVVEYPQGWLAKPLERNGQKQAVWRTDPARSGPGGCILDIGVHAFNLAEYVSAERVAAFVADLTSVVPGRLLDDDCNVLLRFEGGQPGVLIASQVCSGERNAVKLRVYGNRCSLSWSHDCPDRLHIEHPNCRTEILHAGGPDLEAGSRLPYGHPEGYVEAFASIYRDFAAAMAGQVDLIDGVLPGIDAGVRSMAFVEGAVAASRVRAGWTKLVIEGAA